MPPGITIEMELPSRTLKSDSTMKATVVVDNRSGKEPHFLYCGLFAIALSNDKVTAGAGFLSCGLPFTLPKGRSSYPAAVTAQYDHCSDTLGKGDDILCGPNHTPPGLPPGQYKATLYQSVKLGPDPAPIDVTVT